MSSIVHLFKELAGIEAEQVEAIGLIMSGFDVSFQNMTVTTRTVDSYFAQYGRPDIESYGLAFPAYRWSDLNGARNLVVIDQGQRRVEFWINCKK